MTNKTELDDEQLKKIVGGQNYVYNWYCPFCGEGYISLEDKVGQACTGHIFEFILII